MWVAGLQQQHILLACRARQRAHALAVAQFKRYCSAVPYRGYSSLSCRNTTHTVSFLQTRRSRCRTMWLFAPLRVVKWPFGMAR